MSLGGRLHLEIARDVDLIPGTGGLKVNLSNLFIYFCIIYRHGKKCPPARPTPHKGQAGLWPDPCAGQVELRHGPPCSLAQPRSLICALFLIFFILFVLLHSYILLLIPYPRVSKFVFLVRPSLCLLMCFCC